jgi:hypothetical protein
MWYVCGIIAITIIYLDFSNKHGYCQTCWFSEMLVGRIGGIFMWVGYVTKMGMIQTIFVGKITKTVFLKG